MAKDGLRNLALASKEVDGVEANAYEDLTFLGLIGLEDPPRKDVRYAISACRDAGVTIVMVTGDQAETAWNVGVAVGLIDNADETLVTHAKDIRSPDQLSQEERSRLLRTPVFARVSPEQKLDLIALHQRNNSVVAMTGDGVNDAPALKKADIGVAMGQRGTQVAREAAAELGLEIVEMTISGSSEVLQGAQSLSTKDIDVFFTVLDNVVMDAFDSLAKVADQERIPLIAPATGLAEQGAAIGVGWDYFDNGYLSGQLVVRVMKGESPADIPFQPLAKKLIYVNPAAAQRQGFTIPPSLLERADKVLEETE